MSTHSLGIPLNELSSQVGFYPNWIMDFHTRYGLFSMNSQLNNTTRRMEYFFPEDAVHILRDVKTLLKYGMRLVLAAEFVRHKDLYLGMVEKLTANRLTTDRIRQIAQQAELPKWEQLLFERVFLERMNPIDAIQNSGIPVVSREDLIRYCYSAVRMFAEVILFDSYTLLNPGIDTYSQKDFAEIPYASFKRLSGIEKGNLFITNPIPYLNQLSMYDIEKAFLLGILVGRPSAKLAKQLGITESQAKEVWYSALFHIGWLFLYPYMLKEKT